MAIVSQFQARPRRNVELILLILAVFVAMCCYAMVTVERENVWPSGMLTYGAGLAGITGVLHVALRIRAPYADPIMLPVATALNGIGLAMIHRLDVSKAADVQTLAPKQLMWAAVGVILATAGVFLLKDYRKLRRYTYIALISGFLLLALPVLLMEEPVNGARIWIRLGPMSFQPGEIAKIVLTIFFASYLVSNRDQLALAGRKTLGIQLPRGRDLGPILIAWLMSVLILVGENDLGTSLLFFGIFVALLYVATERVSWIAIGMVLFSAGCTLAYSMFGHVAGRVDTWLDPFSQENYDKKYGSYQLVQGLFGIAKGGLTGTGLGAGRPQIVKFAESDFIYTSLAEELGLVGVFAIVVLFMILCERGIRTAIGSRDGFGKLLACGLAFAVCLQSWVVIGGVTGLIPLTGLTLPFVAYGGSSLVANWMIIGLLLLISHQARMPAPVVESQIADDVDIEDDPLPLAHDETHDIGSDEPTQATVITALPPNDQTTVVNPYPPTPPPLPPAPGEGPVR